MFGHPGFDNLSRWLDGMLPPRAQENVGRHLESCAACRGKKEALVRVKTALQGLVPIEKGNPVNRKPSRSIPAAAAPLKVHRWMAVAGIMGLCFAGVLFLQVPQPALKVVSSSPPVDAVASDSGSQISPGPALRTRPSGYVDLELPGQLLLRLKPGTTLTWQQMDRPLFARKPTIVVNLMRGELLARTKETFWGSHLVVRTPSASALVKGTAFSLQVDPRADSTTLKVAAGAVFFSPYLDGVGREVKAGQKSRIRSEHLPTSPEAISPEEWKNLLEAYQIGQEPWVALVVGGGPERVDELFRPALLYLSSWSHPQLQDFFRKTVRELNAAVLKDDFSRQEINLKILEMTLNDITDQRFAVPLRFFAGACAARIGDPQRAYTHFSWVARQCPDAPLASLSVAAIAVLAEKQMRNPSLVHESYQKILDRYPKSPEAVLAREYFRRRSS